MIQNTQRLFWKMFYSLFSALLSLSGTDTESFLIHNFDREISKNALCNRSYMLVCTISPDVMNLMSLSVPQ